MAFCSQPHLSTLSLSILHFSFTRFSLTLPLLFQHPVRGMNGCRGNCLLQWNLAVAETLMETNTERSLSLSLMVKYFSPLATEAVTAPSSLHLCFLFHSPLRSPFFPLIVTLSIPFFLRLSTCPLPLSHCFSLKHSNILLHFRKKQTKTKQWDRKCDRQKQNKSETENERQHVLSYFHYFNSVVLRFGSFAHLFHTQQRDRERETGALASPVFCTAELKWSL